MATRYYIQAWFMTLGFGAGKLVSDYRYQHTCTWPDYPSEREAITLVRSQPIVRRNGNANRWTWDRTPTSPGMLPQQQDTWPEVVGELQGEFHIFRYELQEVWGKGYYQVKGRRLLRRFDCPGYDDTADLRQLLERELAFYEDRTDELAETTRKDIRAGLSQLDIGAAQVAVVKFVNQERQQLLSAANQQREQAELATVRRGADGYLSKLRQPTTQQLLEQVTTAATHLEISSG